MNSTSRSTVPPRTIHDHGSNPARMLGGVLVVLCLVVLGMFVGVITAAIALADAPDEEPGYVTVVWAMPSWAGPQTPTWPQTLVGSVTTSAPDLTAAAELIPCGVPVQVDIYLAGPTTDALLAGGVLYGPGNPPESLIPGGWGTAYTVTQGPACEPEPSPTPTVTPTPTPTETVAPTPSPEPTPTVTVISDPVPDVAVLATTGIDAGWGLLIALATIAAGVELVWFVRAARTQR